MVLLTRLLTAAQEKNDLKNSPSINLLGFACGVITRKSPVLLDRLSAGHKRPECDQRLGFLALGLR